MEPDRVTYYVVVKILAKEVVLSTSMCIESNKNYKSKCARIVGGFSLELDFE